VHLNNNDEGIQAFNARRDRHVYRLHCQSDIS
jgi:hypothetical protein